jgi:hypothetical protein
VPIDSREHVVVRPNRAPRDKAAASRRPPATRRVRPRRTFALFGVIGLVIVLATAAFAVSRLFQSVVPSCTATIGKATYRIDSEQAANARTIAAVARSQGMPNHAVTVALAAAFQESKLHNIGHGDRDSVGLFQQRPSQGWGTVAQLTTPTYAAAAFYQALGRVQGWESMSVTEAAQHVQRSAAPDAYAKWESEARVLARILTGEVPDRLVCS